MARFSRHVMNFLKTSFYTGLSTGISLVTRLITNKIVAVYLGTQGMFLLGQLRDFIKLSTVISSFGISNGIIKYVAEYKEKNSQLQDILSTGFSIHLVLSIVVMLVTLLFNQSISQFLFNDTGYSGYIKILAFSIACISIHSFFISIINGLKAVKLYVIINICATLLSGAILVVLVLKFNIEGAFYAIAINQILTFLIGFLIILIFKPFPLKLILGFINWNRFKALSKFSVMAVAGPGFLIAITFSVRYFLSQEFDENHAGSWEGMWRISAIYLLFLTTTFRFYLLPTFSSLSGKDLKKEIFKVWKFILPAVVLITISVYLGKDIVIVLLFSEEFILINSLIAFHLLGDVFKINCWVLGNVIISKANTKVFILFQLEWALVFAVLAYFFIKGYGFVGVSIAYFIAYVVHFLVMNIYFRKLLWIKSKD